MNDRRYLTCTCRGHAISAHHQLRRKMELNNRLMPIDIVDLYIPNLASDCITWYSQHHEWDKICDFICFVESKSEGWMANSYSELNALHHQFLTQMLGEAALTSKQRKNRARSNFHHHWQALLRIDISDDRHESENRPSPQNVTRKLKEECCASFQPSDCVELTSALRSGHPDDSQDGLPPSDNDLGTHGNDGEVCVKVQTYTKPDEKGSQNQSIVTNEPVKSHVPAGKTLSPQGSSLLFLTQLMSYNDDQIVVLFTPPNSGQERFLKRFPLADTHGYWLTNCKLFVTMDVSLCIKFRRHYALMPDDNELASRLELQLPTRAYALRKWKWNVYAKTRYRIHTNKQLWQLSDTMVRDMCNAYSHIDCVNLLARLG